MKESVPPRCPKTSATGSGGAASRVPAAGAPPVAPRRYERLNSGSASARRRREAVRAKAVSWRSLAGRRSATPALRTPKNTLRAPVALAITGRRRGPGGARQVSRTRFGTAQKGFSGALLRLVSDVVQGQKLRKGCRVWVDRGGGVVAGTPLHHKKSREGAS